MDALGKPGGEKGWWGYFGGAGSMTNVASVSALHSPLAERARALTGVDAVRAGRLAGSYARAAGEMAPPGVVAV